MERFQVLGFCLAVSVLLAIPGVVTAQLAKQGKFETISTFDINIVETQKLGDLTMSLIKSNGIILNKAGSGFMHNTTALCMLTTITGAFHGYCTVTDLDGDMIFQHIYTDAKFTLGTSGGGRRIQLLDGTGKYKGIQGEAPYDVVYAPKVEGKLRGHAITSGEYRIP